MSNPYQSPEIAEPAKLQLRIPSWVSLIAWLYPFILLGSFYITWLIAWTALGHQPIPSIDDPKSIGWVVDVPYIAAGLLLMAFPVAVIGGIGIQFLPTEKTWPKKLFLAGLLALLWYATIMLMRMDPLDVGTWYMD